MDLIDEIRFRLGDHGLDFVDLLIDNLVNVLHVVEHLVGLLVELVELRLVVFEFNLPTVHLLPGVVLLDLGLDALHNLFRIGGGLGGVKVRVLMVLVVPADGLLPLELNRPPELLDIARE